MAALTRSGARNASEIVILTLRTLHHGFNVAADDGIGDVGSDRATANKRILIRKSPDGLR